MKITQNYFDKYLDQNYIFEKKPKIAVAVSGGPDSMCLLFLLKEWIYKKKGAMVALIIDHGLRQDSSIEAKYISNYLYTQNISSKIIKISKKNIYKKTMAEARENRFNSLLNHCKNKKILHVFVAHHLDDNFETYLIRKIAGSNFDGLSGIKKRVILKHVQILRPLLKIKKIDILKYNKSNKINFVLDPTNENLSYTRTVVRNFLKKENSYKKNIEKEFNKINDNYKAYKKMIFYSFHESIIKITAKTIEIDAKIFLIKDILVQSKIIEIIYGYLKSSKTNLRYKKILPFLDNLNNKTNYQLNLAGLLVKKENFIIKFKS